MLAKLSLVFNIVLAYVVAVLHQDEGVLQKEIVACHAERYKDLESLMVRLNFLKAKVDNEYPTEEISKEIQKIAKDQKKAVTE